MIKFDDPIAFEKLLEHLGMHLLPEVVEKAVRSGMNDFIDLMPEGRLLDNEAISFVYARVLSTYVQQLWEDPSYDLMVPEDEDQG